MNGYTFSAIVLCALFAFMALERYLTHLERMMGKGEEEKGENDDL